MNNKYDLPARALLLVNLVVYAAFFAGFTFWPQVLATHLLAADFHAAAGVADLRAVYGGLSAGAGFFILKGIMNRTQLAHALRLTVYLALGLGLERIFSFAIGGVQTINLYTGLSLASEIFAALAGLFLLRLWTTEENR